LTLNHYVRLTNDDDECLWLLAADVQLHSVQTGPITLVSQWADIAVSCSSPGAMRQMLGPSLWWLQ